MSMTMLLPIVERDRLKTTRINSFGVKKINGFFVFASVEIKICSKPAQRENFSLFSDLCNVFRAWERFIFQMLLDV